MQIHELIAGSGGDEWGAGGSLPQHQHGACA